MVEMGWIVASYLTFLLNKIMQPSSIEVLTSWPQLLMNGLAVLYHKQYNIKVTENVPFEELCRYS